MPNQTDTASSAKPSLVLLFFTFSKIGLMMFGGGYAMLPILQREIVENKGWASDEDLANYFAIGQCTPGVIAVNTATFIGHKKRGALGAIAATLGVVFPSLVIITCLAGLISSFADNPYVQRAFAGIRVCVCALILKSIIKLFKGAVKDAVTLAVFLAVIAVSLLFDLSPVLIVIVVAAIAVILVLTGGPGKPGMVAAGTGKTSAGSSDRASAGSKEVRR